MPARPLLLLGAALALGACASEPPSGPPLAFARVQVFCYRTLADTTCHPRPLPGEAHRYTGVAWSGVHQVPLLPTPGPRTGPS